MKSTLSSWIKESGISLVKLLQLRSLHCYHSIQISYRSGKNKKGNETNTYTYHKATLCRLFSTVLRMVSEKFRLESFLFFLFFFKGHYKFFNEHFNVKTSSQILLKYLQVLQSFHIPNVSWDVSINHAIPQYPVFLHCSCFIRKYEK